MSLVVVGGQSRSAGKTSAVCSLIAAMPERRWTALKITQYGHGICSKDGKPCDCAVDDSLHPFAVSAERDGLGTTDTARYLRAGAAQAWWLRAPMGRLDLAMPFLEEILASDESVIAESNSLLDFVSADVYLSLWDGSISDIKPSARKHVDKADALLVSNPGEPLGTAPRFVVEPPKYITAAVLGLVRHKLGRPHG